MLLRDVNSPIQKDVECSIFFTLPYVMSSHSPTLECRKNVSPTPEVIKLSVRRILFQKVKVRNNTLADGELSI